MENQTESDEYRRAWLEAERQVLIIGFQTDNPWAWMTSPPESAADESSLIPEPTAKG